MAKYWRYFRVEGDPPTFTGENVFTIAIHHGGRLYSNSGIDRVYKGGEVLFVDGVDPEKMALTELNCWAYDIGYCKGPIAYWYRIPGSEEGSGYLPLSTDADVIDMVQFVPKYKGVLDVYIVCLAARRGIQELELEGHNPFVDHISYYGHFIEDMPLIVADPIVQKEHVVQEEHVDSIFNDEELMNHLFGEAFGHSQQGCSGIDFVSRRRPTIGVHIREPSEREERNEPALSALISLQSKDKGKRKQKVVEKPKKKARRPKKQKVYNTRSGGECSRPIPEEEVDDWSEDSNDADYDAIVDSDYELNPEDDEDVFDAHVETGGVHEFDEMGYEGNISDDLDEGANSDGFVSAHDSDDVGVDDGPFKVKGKKRFSKWIEFDEKNDMKNPRFCLGMIFPNNKVFKHAVRKHSVMTKKELRFVRNTKHMISVKCFTSVGCPYYMYASSPNMDNPTLQIKKYKPKHTCCSIGKKVYHCNAPFLAEEYKNQFLADGKWSREGIQNAVAEDFEMKIGFQLAHRAKAKALRMAQGTIEDQYNNLESYAHELKKRNPGSSVWIKTELDKNVAKFQRIYICLSALKEGWNVGCRPIIGLDGCHLKGVHKGQLLSAIGIDGNNGMYPIAWAIVEGETFDIWTWFLTFLKEDLDIHHSRHYAFMSDKQKGLEASVKNLFPEAEHRFCVRHMHNNFKGDGHIGLELKQRLWAIARATTMVKYKQAMLDMREASISAWKWCLERTAKHWSRSHFDVFFQCDILLNNHSESFNHSILEARKKPIIPCLEDIRVAAMVRLANRRNSAARWKCKVGPRIEKILKKNASWASQYRPLESSNFRFELEGRSVACESGVIAQHSVKLDTMSCSCRRWDLCGLPCGHAIAAIYSKGWSPDDFVSEWYTLKRYMQAYEVMIHPIAGFAEWEKIERKIAPPLYRRQPGRPKTKRNLEPGEVPPPVGIERLSKSYYSKGTCGMCRKPGHNARTCARRNPVTSTANSQQPQQAPNDPPQQQAANEPPSDVNVNLNLNVNVNVSMHDESGAANDIHIPSEHINMVQPTQESTTTPIAPTSSQKRYKRPAMRVNSPKVDQRKSARHAASGASNSTTIPPPKNQPRKRLWKP